MGKNYHAHAKEFARSGFDSSAKAGGEIPAEPIIFTKVPECVIATGEAIEMPKVSTAIDYEAELTVIIGKGGKGITKASAMQHVWGYTIVNEYSLPEDSYYRPAVKAKCRDGFCAIGPELVPTAQLSDPHSLAITLYVNGEVRQQSLLDQMIWNVPEILHELSKLWALKAGDLVFMGTPAGVAALKPGDRFSARLENVAERHGIISE